MGQVGAIREPGAGFFKPALQALMTCILWLPAEQCARFAVVGPQSFDFACFGAQTLCVSFNLNLLTRINRELRIRESVTQATGTISTQTLALPSGYIETVRLTLDTTSL